MDNLYNILYKEPALKRYELADELEDLTHQLIASGLIKIDADQQSNFVRFAIPTKKINMVFSYRQLCDEELIDSTKHTIKSALSYHYTGSVLANKTDKEFTRLQKEVKKIFAVDYPTEIKMARTLVQTIDSIVIMLLLEEKADIYVSYSHNIGDMLDVKSWQDVGENSGLQSTDNLGANVFISCDGNPFLEEDEKRHPGEGFNALARLMIIGAQELAHYADLIRDKRGRKIGRHSATNSRPKRKVKLARLNDIESCNNIIKILNQINIKKLTELERYAKFFKEQNRGGFIKYNTNRKIRNSTRNIINQFAKHDIEFLSYINKDEDGHIATQIVNMTKDMAFNLAPKADVYKRDDPNEEEAVACIEALARVPQQVNKWGHQIVKSISPNLYDIYYNEVIPSCIKAYENISGNKYTFTTSKKPFLVKLKQKYFSKDL